MGTGFAGVVIGQGYCPVIDHGCSRYTGCESYGRFSEERAVCRHVELFSLEERGKEGGEDRIGVSGWMIRATDGVWEQG